MIRIRGERYKTNLDSREKADASSIRKKKSPLLRTDTIMRPHEEINTHRSVAKHFKLKQQRKKCNSCRTKSGKNSLL